MAEVTMTVLLFDPARSQPAKDDAVASGHPDGEPKAPHQAPEWVRRAARSMARPTSLVVLAATIVGAGIRLDVTRGVWLDEGISISDVRMPYVAMIHRLATQDVHPPLYFTILWVSARLIGLGDYAVKVPSIILGIALIPLVYLLGKEAYDRKTGAVAAVIAAFAPYVVWYSQEARMYELLMVFGVLALWAQLRIFHRGGWYPWALYTVASAAMVATQYFGMWQLAAQQLIFIGVIVYRWRRHEKPWAILRPWLISSVLLLAALIPLGLMMKGQFTIAQNTGQAFRGAAGAGLTIYSVMTNIGYSVVGFHSQPIMSDLIALWPLVMLAALAVLGRRCKPVTFLLIATVVVPVAAMFLLGDLKQSLSDVRYQSTVVPVLLVLIARTLTTVATSKRALTVAVVVVIAGLSVALFDQQFSSSNPRRYNFREALTRVDTHAKPGDEIMYDPINDQLNDVISYYSPKIKNTALTTRPDPTSTHGIYIVSSSILMDGLDHYVLHTALDNLNKEHKQLVEHWVFPNVQVWEYR